MYYHYLTQSSHYLALQHACNQYTCTQTHTCLLITSTCTCNNNYAATPTSDIGPPYSSLYGSFSLMESGSLSDPDALADPGTTTLSLHRSAHLAPLISPDSSSTWPNLHHLKKQGARTSRGRGNKMPEAATNAATMLHFVSA